VTADGLGGGEDCGDRRQDQRYGRKKTIGKIFSTRGHAGNSSFSQNNIDEYGIPWVEI